MMGCGKEASMTIMGLDQRRWTDGSQQCWSYSRSLGPWSLGTGVYHDLLSVSQFGSGKGRGHRVSREAVA